jgi:FkbM family methyltransferase
MSNNINYSPRLPNLFKELNMDNHKTFFLIDVGASAGIDRCWSSFGDKLEAIGFDPLISEVERLNLQNNNPRIKYEEAFVIYKDFDKHYPADLRNKDSATYNSFNRTSSVRATQAQNYNYIENHFNDGKPIVYSKRSIQLDDFVKQNNITDVDFIKIDADGHDFPVLLGSSKILDNSNILGIQVEAQFHGSPHPYANTFSNIDQFLKSKGFTLFNLDNYYYSRGSLPAKFLYRIFAQTVTGQIQWGEALYFRDLADKTYTQRFNFPVTIDKVVKLACLYEIYGLNDCAAELLINRAEELNFTQHLNVLLDSLTPPFRGKKIEYKEYVKRFDKNPENWFTSVEEEVKDNISKRIISSGWFIIKPLYYVYKLFKKLSQKRSF